MLKKTNSNKKTLTQKTLKRMGAVLGFWSGKKVAVKKVFYFRKIKNWKAGFGSGNKSEIKNENKGISKGSDIFKGIKEIKWADVAMGVKGLREVKLRTLFRKPFSRRMGALAVLVLFLVANFFQNSLQTQGAQFTFAQTDWSGGVTANTAVHPTNENGWNQYSAGTNVVTNVAGQATLAETNHESFSETFTGTTYKDAGSTTANWNTGTGKIEMPSESAGVDLYAKLQGILVGSTINAQVKAGDDYYIGSSAGKFLKYNSATDTATDLTAKTSSILSGNAIARMALDSVNNIVYLAGYNSGAKFIRYNTASYVGGGTYPTADTAYDLTAKISAFFPSSTLSSLVFDSAHNVLYIVGSNGTFARYNTTAYAAGGTYPTADTGYDLAAKISSFWSVSGIFDIVLDSANSVVYLGGNSGKLARYNATFNNGLDATYPTADTAYDIKPQISGFYLNDPIKTMQFDPANNVLYGAGYNSGGGDSKFFRYNTTSYAAAGTYPTADTGYDLTAKISAVFGSNRITSSSLDATNNALYLGGNNGRFARYNTTSYSGGGTYSTADTGYDLTAKVSSFFSGSNSEIPAIVLDTVNNVIYLGGQSLNSSKFARYNTTSYVAGGTYPTADTTYDLTSKVNGADWNGNVVRAIVAASGNELYIGGDSGKFAKYNTATGVATELTSKISAFWSSSYAINALAFDSANNVVYLGGGLALFARYNTASYVAGGTYPTANTAYNLSAKISFSSKSIYSIAFDSVNKVVYVSGEQGKFYRYNSTFYTAGGTYPTANTGYDLNAKISAFWSTNGANSLAFDSASSVLYVAGDTGALARYNTTFYAAGGTYPTADTAYDLSSKLSSFWSSNNNQTSFFDSANNVLYLGSWSGKFARYNTASWSGSGTCAATGSAYAADTACNLTAKISSFWSGSVIYYSALDSVNGAVYLGGGSGKFARYSIGTDSATNLRSPDALSFWSTSSIYALAVDSNAKVYIGGASGYFAEKASAPAITSAYSTTLDAVAYNIVYATLTKTDTVGTGTIAYALSNDGGATWETVTPAVNHVFASTGSDLRFKITVSGNATVQDIAIAYWSFNTTGDLTSSKYNASDSANVLAKMEWSETLPAGTDVKFQLRTSSDGSSWTAWCGPDDGVPGSCNSGTYFTAPTGTETIDDLNNDHTNDQYYQYKAYLTSSGLGTPILSDTTVTYVVNAPPQAQITSASEGADGLVTVNYQVLDPDTDTGVTYRAVNVTLQYCTADCAGAGTWADATAPALSGNFGAGVSVIQGDWTPHQVVWNPTIDYANHYNATDFKVRIKAYDGELANHTAYGTSASFILDTSKPTLNATTVLINDSSSAVQLEASALTIKLQNVAGDTASETVYAQFSKDGATWYGANSDNTLAASGSWGTGFALNNLASLSWPWTMTERSQTIQVRIRDGYNNVQSSTDSNTVAYNATPAVQTVSASQGSTGTVAVSYEIKDTDTAIGATPNVLNVTLQYCTANCGNSGSETWTDATAPALSGNFGAGVATTASFVTKNIVWTPKTDYADQYIGSDFKVRVAVDDGESFNNSAAADSGSFILDTTDPTNNSFSIDHTTNQLTLTTPSDDSSYQMSVSNTAGVFSTFEPFVSPYTYNGLTADPATVYVRIKDAYGNYLDATATTPAKPMNPIYFDISSAAQGTYQEFVAWDVVSGAQVGSGFGSYQVYRKINSGDFEALGDPIADRTLNYVLDRIKDTNDATTDSDPTFDPANPSTYYYKIVTTDSNGDVSAFSGVTQDAPNGTGGSDSTPPTISNVAVSSIDTTSATITWETDELANSSVGYSTDYTYVPERALASFATTNHRIVLTGLESNTTYHIRVISEDIYNNEGAVCYGGPGCSNGSNPTGVFTFTTDPGPEISSVSVSSTNTQAIVSWVTTTNSDTHVAYSDQLVKDGYGNPVVPFELDSPAEVGTLTPVGGSSIFNHSQLLTTYNDVSLLPGTTYYFYVESMDATNQTAIDNNGGNFYSFTTTQDDDPPVITPDSINAAIINDNKVAINWTTDEASTSVVHYGTALGGPYPDTGEVLTFDKSHYVILSGLSPYTDYYYTVTSADINTNSVTSGENTFTTLMNPEQQHAPLSSMTATIDETEYDLTDADSAAVFAPSVLTDVSAVIDFNTDQIAMCTINYTEDGQAYNDNNVIVETGYNTDHCMHIMGLILDTKYRYKIECVDNLPEGQAGMVNSTEFNFTTKMKQVDHPVLENPGDPEAVLTADVEAVVQLPTLNTEATSKLCYNTSAEGEITDVDTCSHFMEITTPSRVHSYYLDGLDPKQTYYIKTKVIDSADGANIFVSSDGVTFETLDTLVEHADLTDPGNPTVIQKSDTEATIALPTANTTATSKLCYSTSAGINIDSCSDSKTIDTAGRLQFYHLTDLASGTTYYFKTKIFDSEYPDIFNFTSEELSFVTSGGNGSGMDSVNPNISGVSAKVNSGESVTVSWDTDELTNSYVQYSITSGTYTDMAGDPLVNLDKANYATAHAVIVNGLIPGIKYFFTATCTDAAGNIATSSESTFTTGTSSSLSSINISSASLGEALITWTTSEKTSSLVEYGTTNTYGQKKEDTAAVTAHSMTVNGLTVAQLYHLRVGGKDASGQRYSSGDYTFTPKSPPQIGAVAIRDINEHGATVSFATDFPTDYTVTYSASNDSGSKGKPDYALNHEITLDNLKPGTTYVLKIKASDEQGNSVEKEAPSFTTGKDENAPEITKARTESALAQSDKVQTIISWDTNELSTCALIYREGAGGDEKEYQLNDRAALSHVAVVTSFKPGTVYYFKIKSTDEADNESVSSEYALLTPQKKENIVQIIVNNFQDIFSWVDKVGN